MATPGNTRPAPEEIKELLQNDPPGAGGNQQRVVRQLARGRADAAARGIEHDLLAAQELDAVEATEGGGHLVLDGRRNLVLVAVQPAARQ